MEQRVFSEKSKEQNLSDMDVKSPPRINLSPDLSREYMIHNQRSPIVAADQRSVNNSFLAAMNPSRNQIGARAGSYQLDPRENCRLLEERIENLKKQQSQEKAQLTKKLALLEQQNDNLKVQLQESQQRERTQKDFYERQISYLQQQLTESQSVKHQIVPEQIDENHPRVREIVNLHQTKAQLSLLQEKDKYSQKERKDELEIQSLRHQLKDLERDLNILKCQNSSYADEHQRIIEQEKQQSSLIFQEFKEQAIQERKQVENQLESVKMQERADRLQLLNKHIEHVDSLQENIKKLNRDLTESQNLNKQLQLDLEKWVVQGSQKDQENLALQDQLLDLEQALIQMEKVSAEQQVQFTQKFLQLEQENQQLTDQKKILQEKLAKFELQKDQKTSKQQQVGAKTKQQVLKQGRQDYFSVITGNARTDTSNTSWSSRNSGRQKSSDQSYTRLLDESKLNQSICADLEEKCNKLNRQVAQFRSQAKDLEIQLKECQIKHKKEKEHLNAQIKAEQKRREDLQIDFNIRWEQVQAEIARKDKIIQSSNTEREIQIGSCYTAIQPQKKKQVLSQRTTLRKNVQTLSEEKQEATPPKSKKVAMNADLSPIQIINQQSLDSLEQNKTSPIIEQHQQQPVESRNHEISDKQINYETTERTELDENQDEEEKKTNETKQELNEYYHMLHASPPQNFSKLSKEERKEASLEIIDIQLITEETPQNQRINYNPRAIDALQNSLMHLARDRLISGNTSENDTVESIAHETPLTQKDNLILQDSKPTLSDKQSNEQTIQCKKGKQSFTKPKQVTLSIAKSTSSLKSTTPTNKLAAKSSQKPPTRPSLQFPTQINREYTSAFGQQQLRKPGSRKPSR